MTHFEEHGYQIVKNAISKETARLAELEFSLLRHNRPDSIHINDPLIENAFYWYGSLVSESITMMLQPKVESITGLQLYPTYSFGRIYDNKATMKKHTDRPSCEYSATLTISVDQNAESWPIKFINRDGQEKSIHLDVGDMCVYKGIELEHWRDEYSGTSQTQFFLHYVDQNGPYADFKYDKRQMLGGPFA